MSWLLAPAGAVGSVNDIGDVTVTSVTSGEVLQWNGSAWINRTFAEAGISSVAAFDDLSDVDLTGAANNDLLYRSGGNWVDSGGKLTYNDTTNEFKMTHQSVADEFSVTLDGTNCVIDTTGTVNLSFTGRTGSFNVGGNGVLQDLDIINLDGAAPAINFDTSSTFRAGFTCFTSALVLDVSGTTANQFQVADGLISLVEMDSTDPLRIYGGGSEAAYAALSYNWDDQYGNLQVSGSTRGGYLGVALDVPSGDTITFMSSTSNGGIYNDTDDLWWALWSDGGDTTFYTWGDGQAKLYLKANEAASAVSSSANVLDHDSIVRPVGFNTMRLVDQNVSVTLGAEHCGGMWYHNDSTAYTVTVSAGTDYPTGGMTMIINHSDTAVTIAQSGTTLIWQDGTATAATGNRTMSNRGVATVWKISGSAWFIWGIGLS